MESDVPTFAKTSEAREQRRHPRFAIPSLPLVIHGQPATAALIVNISRSGVGIVADRLLGEPGERLVGEMSNPIESGPVILPCSLRWAVAEKEPSPSRTLRWLHGAAFIELDGPAQSLVRRLHRER